LANACNLHVKVAKTFFATADKHIGFVYCTGKANTCGLSAKEDFDVKPQQRQ